MLAIYPLSTYSIYYIHTYTYTHLYQCMHILNLFCLCIVIMHAFLLSLHEYIYYSYLSCFASLVFYTYLSYHAYLVFCVTYSLHCIPIVCISTLLHIPIQFVMPCLSSLVSVLQLSMLT